MEGDEPFPYTNLEVSGPADAEPILLLHGWGSSALLMRPIASALAGDYRVLNVDLPGHGHSPYPPRPWGIPEHAALVAHLIESHIAGPVTLVGHSNGGRIGLFMASDDRYQHLLTRLILISPSGIRPDRGPRYYLRRGIASLLKAPFAALPEPLRGFGLDWLRHSLVWQLLGSSDYRSLDGVMRETFVRTVNFFVDDRLERVLVPTLLFWGDRDTAVSRRQIEVLEQGIPDAGLVVLTDAGHYGYLDDPGTFLAATRYFLSHSGDLARTRVEADTA